MKKNISLVLLSFVLVSSGITLIHGLESGAARLKERQRLKAIERQHKLDYLKARFKRPFGRGKEPVITQKTPWQRKDNPYQSEYDQKRSVLGRVKDTLFRKTTTTGTPKKSKWKFWQ